MCDVRLFLVAAALSGCSVSPVVDGAIPAAEVPPAPFPECMAAEYAYVGRTTPLAIGLRDAQGAAFGPDASRVGMIWITADPVEPEPMPGVVQPEPTRWMCMQFADGSGLATGVDPDWRPPGVAAEEDGDGAPSVPPIEPVVIALVTLGVIGVSVLAFRGNPHTPGS